MALTTRDIDKLCQFSPMIFSWKSSNVRKYLLCFVKYQYYIPFHLTELLLPTKVQVCPIHSRIVDVAGNAMTELHSFDCNDSCTLYSSNTGCILTQYFSCKPSVHIDVASCDTNVTVTSMNVAQHHVSNRWLMLWTWYRNWVWERKTQYVGPANTAVPALLST